MSTLGRVFLDNAGGITLQFIDYAHTYTSAAEAADSITMWLDGADPTEWESDEKDLHEFEPDDAEIAKGTYCMIDIDRAKDTQRSIANKILLEGNDFINAELLAYYLTRI
jgi:hypothetical protein